MTNSYFVGNSTTAFPVSACGSVLAARPLGFFNIDKVTNRPPFARRRISNHSTESPRASELHARVRLGEDPGGEKIENRARAAQGKW
jgi:hypothetical protein